MDLIGGRQQGKSLSNKQRVDAAIGAGYKVIVASRDGLQLRYKRQDGSIAVEDVEHEKPQVYFEDFQYFRYPD